MELENFGVNLIHPPESLGSYYYIWIKTRNQKKLRFNHTLEQIMDTKSNIYIRCILEETENFCKHNSLRDVMKLEDAIDYLRGITDGWKTTNAESIKGSFLDTCCKDHLQLMEWLIELKKYKMKYGEL